MSDTAPGGGLPPAGWHPDPAGSPQERWWSGVDWTDHLRDVPQAAPSPEPGPAPEPEEYQPMGGWKAGNVPQPYVAPVGSPNTVAIWLIAFSPLLTIGALLLLLLAHTPPTPTGIFFGIGLIAVGVGLVFWDNATLNRRNLPVASPLWLLLAGIAAYLIVRWVKLRGVGVHNAAPGIVLAFLLFALSVVGGYFVAVEVVSIQQDSAYGSLEPQIASALNDQTDGAWTVTCPETEPSSLPGTTFTCSAQDLTGRTLTVSIKVLSSGRYELVDATDTPAG